MAEWPVPRPVTDVRSFTSFCSYYRKFVPAFSQVSAPLHDLTRKYARFHWTAECQRAFEELKHRLISAPILALPSDEGCFSLDYDASYQAVGAILAQLQDGDERVVAYYSRRYCRSINNYCITRKELLAVISGLKQFRQYLLGRSFIVRTDHVPLLWLSNTPQPVAQQSRWIDFLAGYDFQIQHRAGRVHNNADALSRIPFPCDQCGRLEIDDNTLSLPDAEAYSMPNPCRAVTVRNSPTVLFTGDN